MQIKTWIIIEILTASIVFWKCVGEVRRIDTFSLGLKPHSNLKVLTTLCKAILVWP